MVRKRQEENTMKKLLLVLGVVFMLVGCSGGNDLTCTKERSETSQEVANVKFNSAGEITEISLDYQYHDLDETVLRSLLKGFESADDYVDQYDGYSFNLESTDTSINAKLTVDTTKFAIAETEGADPMVLTFGSRPEEKTREEIQDTLEDYSFVCNR